VVHIVIRTAEAYTSCTLSRARGALIGLRRIRSVPFARVRVVRKAFRMKR
jgi:hypothetical protein